MSGIQYFRRLAAAGALAGSLVFSGCGRSDESAEDAVPELRGEILAVDAGRNVLTVRHAGVPGVLSAGTADFAASRGDVAIAQPGQRIRARLAAGGESGRLERIWPDDAVAGRVLEEAEKALRQDTIIRGRGAYREVGERMPGFALYDQNGELVQATRFFGKNVVLNFIFTRCTVPTMCPASTARMVSLQQMAKEGGIEDLQLVTVTLDPDYDTPGVLTEYARTHGIDMSNFTLLTGPEPMILDLLTQMGILRKSDERDIFVHTLATIMVNENGRIVHRVDGSVWEPEDFLSRLQPPAE